MSGELSSFSPSFGLKFLTFHRLNVRQFGEHVLECTYAKLNIKDFSFLDLYQSINAIKWTFSQRIQLFEVENYKKCISRLPDHLKPCTQELLWISWKFESQNTNIMNKLWDPVTLLQIKHCQKKNTGRKVSNIDWRTVVIIINKSVDKHLL